MSPQLRGGEHIVFGADPVFVAHYFENQRLDAYQIFMDIQVRHNKELIDFGDLDLTWGYYSCLCNHAIDACYSFLEQFYQDLHC